MRMPLMSALRITGDTLKASKALHIRGLYYAVKAKITEQVARGGSFMLPVAQRKEQPPSKRVGRWFEIQPVRAIKQNNKSSPRRGLSCIRCITEIRESRYAVRSTETSATGKSICRFRLLPWGCAT